MGAQITKHVYLKSNEQGIIIMNIKTQHAINEWSKKHVNNKWELENDTKTNEGASLVLQNMVVIST